MSASIKLIQAAAGAGGAEGVKAPNAFFSYDDRLNSSYDGKTRATTLTEALGTAAVEWGNGLDSNNEIDNFLCQENGVGGYWYNQRLVDDQATKYFYYLNESHQVLRQTIDSGFGDAADEWAFCISNDGLIGYQYACPDNGTAKLRKFTRDDIYSAWTLGTEKTMPSPYANDQYAGHAGELEFFIFVEGTENNNLVILGNNGDDIIALFDYDSNTTVDTVAIPSGYNAYAVSARSGVVIGSDFVTFCLVNFDVSGQARVYKISVDLSTESISLSSSLYSHSGNSISIGGRTPVSFFPHNGCLVTQIAGSADRLAISNIDLSTGNKGTTYKYNVFFQEHFGLNEAGDEFIVHNAGSIESYSLTTGVKQSDITLPDPGFTEFGVLPYYAADQSNEFYE